MKKVKIIKQCVWCGEEFGCAQWEIKYGKNIVLENV
jgi:hypothetical protein